MKNFKMGPKLLCLIVWSIYDQCGTISDIFVSYLRDLLLKMWRFTKNTLTQSIF